MPHCTPLIIGLALAGCAAQPQPGGVPLPAPTQLDVPAPGNAEQPLARFDEGIQGHFRYNSGLPKEQMIAIRTDEDWRVQWRLITAPSGTAPPVPKVDFEREMLLMAAMGSKGSGGYSSSIDRVVDRGGELVAFIRFGSPGPKCGAIAMITSPVDIVRLPKSDKNIRWEVERVAKECG